MTNNNSPQLSQKDRYAHLIGTGIRPVNDPAADWLIITACSDAGVTLITDAVIPYDKLSQWTTPKGPIHA